MRFCPKCGGELKPVGEVVSGSWEVYKDCERCSLRYHTVFGDYQGGSQDTTTSFPIPCTSPADYVKLLEDKMRERNAGTRRVPRIITLTDDECQGIVEALKKAQIEALKKAQIEVDEKARTIIPFGAVNPVLSKYDKRSGGWEPGTYQNGL